MAKLSEREWVKRQKVRENIKEKIYRSYNSQSMTWCYVIKRKKFLFESEKKADLAVKFSNGRLDRSYVCLSCMGWHTTSETEEEYNQNRLEFSKAHRNI